MKKLKKRIITSVATFFCVMAIHVAVYAASGRYRIYLRQITGYQMSGDLTVSWRW